MVAPTRLGRRVVPCVARLWPTKRDRLHGLGARSTFAQVRIRSSYRARSHRRVRKAGRRRPRVSAARHYWDYLGTIFPVKYSGPETSVRLGHWKVGVWQWGLTHSVVGGPWGPQFTIPCGEFPHSVRLQPEAIRACLQSRTQMPGGNRYTKLSTVGAPLST